MILAVLYLKHYCGQSGADPIGRVIWTSLKRFLKPNLSFFEISGSGGLLTKEWNSEELTRWCHWLWQLLKMPKMWKLDLWCALPKALLWWITGCLLAVLRQDREFTSHVGISYHGTILSTKFTVIQLCYNNALYWLFQVTWLCLTNHSTLF